MHAPQRSQTFPPEWVCPTVLRTPPPSSPTWVKSPQICLFNSYHQWEIPLEFHVTCGSFFLPQGVSLCWHHSVFLYNFFWNVNNIIKIVNLVRITIRLKAKYRFHAPPCCIIFRTLRNLRTILEMLLHRI
jgi:hypothetical protein